MAKNADVNTLNIEKGGEILSKKSWELSNKQKIFLKNEGVDPKDYRIVGATANDYVFYNITTKKLLNVRR